jgi:putative membrane protein
MPTLQQLFSVSDRQAVNHAVQQAELRTSAEILPVVAASSGRYDRPEDIVGLWTGLICLSITWVFYPASDSSPGSWGGPHPGWQLMSFVTVTVLGFLLGAIVGGKIGWLRRLFTPQQQMTEVVLQRARAVFYDNRVHHTQGSSGVLLYVSLFERMAVVIADESVLKALGQEMINTTCTEMTQRLHQGNPTRALCETIHSIGEHLAPVMPRALDDVNELPDALVLLD